MGAVRWQLNVIEIVRTGVEGVGVGVAGQERKPMRGPLSKGHLQAVVVGLILVGHAIDLSYIREFTEERPRRLIHTCITGVASEASWTYDRIACQNLVYRWI